MKFIAKLIMMITIVTGLIFGTASFALADEPVVDLGEVQYAQAQFSADGSAAAKASLKAQSGAKVVLNVHVNPMPKRQIKRCWKVKPGTVIWNEVIDPATGTKKVVRWTVPSNDNTFCTKKGAGKQVFKKSCGNRVWGVPGGPKSPPKSIPRIKVKVQIQDYLTFKGKLKVHASQSGSASAYVVQYYDGKKVCEASASVSGSASAWVEAYISVRARTLTSIKVSATNSAQVSANTQITASGSLKAAVKIAIEGEAKAMCNFTPPDTTPAPDLLEIDTINDVLVNNTRTITIKGTVAPGHTATLFASALNGGSITAGKTQTVSGSFTAQVTYMAPSEVPGANNGVAAGHDQVKVTLTQDDGQKDDISTNQFEIRPAPVDPL